MLALTGPRAPSYTPRARPPVSRRQVVVVARLALSPVHCPCFADAAGRPARGRSRRSRGRTRAGAGPRGLPAGPRAARARARRGAARPAGRPAGRRAGAAGAGDPALAGYSRRLLGPRLPGHLRRGLRSPERAGLARFGAGDAAVPVVHEHAGPHGRLLRDRVRRSGGSAAHAGRRRARAQRPDGPLRRRRGAELGRGRAAPGRRGGGLARRRARFFGLRPGHLHSRRAGSGVRSSAQLDRPALERLSRLRLAQRGLRRLAARPARRGLAGHPHGRRRLRAAALWHRARAGSGGRADAALRAGHPGRLRPPARQLPGTGEPQRPRRAARPGRRQLRPHEQRPVERAGLRAGAALGLQSPAPRLGRGGDDPAIGGWRQRPRARAGQLGAGRDRHADPAADFRTRVLPHRESQSGCRRQRPLHLRRRQRQPRARQRRVSAGRRVRLLQHPVQRERPDAGQRPLRLAHRRGVRAPDLRARFQLDQCLQRPLWRRAARGGRLPGPRHGQLRRERLRRRLRCLSRGGWPQRPHRDADRDRGQQPALHAQRRGRRHGLAPERHRPPRSDHGLHPALGSERLGPQRAAPGRPPAAWRSPGRRLAGRHRRPARVRLPRHGHGRRGRLALPLCASGRAHRGAGGAPVDRRHRRRAGGCPGRGRSGRRRPCRVGPAVHGRPSLRLARRRREPGRRARRPDRRPGSGLHGSPAGQLGGPGDRSAPPCG